MNIILNSLNFIIYFFIGINCQSTEWCLNSTSHKSSPGQEDLPTSNQCYPWKSHSCCTEKTTLAAHLKAENHYNFNFDHCPDHPMSTDCHKHFIQDMCFYECEPNVKPWVVQTTRKFATERIFKVPICSSDCNSWFDKCKDDYTCHNNWARAFKWVNGTNYCTNDSKCNKIKDVFKGAKEFCEQVWDHSWEYTTEDKPCMRIWFNGTYGNPNKNTAQYYVLQQNSSFSSKLNWFTILLFAILENLLRI